MSVDLIWKLMMIRSKGRQAGNTADLGTGDDTTTNEFSEKFQRGSAAVWNVSENASVLVLSPVP